LDRSSSEPECPDPELSEPLFEPRRDPESSLEPLEPDASVVTAPPDPDPLEPLPEPLEPDASVVTAPPASGTLGPVFDTVVEACSLESSISGTEVFGTEPRPGVPGLEPGTATGAATTRWSSTVVTVVDTGASDVLVGAAVVGGTVEVVLVVVVSGAGFDHTERDVGAPRLGNNVSRIANAVPADPINAATAIAATAALPDRDCQRPAPRAGVEATARRDGVPLIFANDSPSPCPRSIQFPPMEQVCPHGRAIEIGHSARRNRTFDLIPRSVRRVKVLRPTYSSFWDSLRAQ
jgi:hypothetical protein